MREKKIRVGVIGTGKIADIAHFPSLLENKDVEIAGILSGTYDLAVEAARRYGVQKPVHDLDELLKQDVDCVFLLTPKTIRTQYLIPLMRAKVDILCEKPLAMTLDECELIANESAKSGKIVMVAFNRRFAPVNQKAKQVFEKEPPEFVYAEKHREMREFRGTLENAIHMVDLLRYFCGEALNVEAHALFDDPFEEYLCTAQFKFDSGAIGLLGASRSAGQWVERVELFGGGKSVFVTTPDSIKIVGGDSETVYTMTNLAQGWARVIDKLGFKPCIDHFIHCVKTRETPLTNVEDAFLTHKLMDTILRKAGLPDLSKDWRR